MVEGENTLNSRSDKLQRRELLYRLIVSQLFYDGYQTIAADLSKAIHADPACPPSDRLQNVVYVGLQHENESQPNRKNLDVMLAPGLDLEFESDVQNLAPEPAHYETAYVTSHKAPCRSGAFSADGQLVATGSLDASIKIIDVDRMLAKSAPDAVETNPSDQQGHPVIRTLYDHLDEVSCLEFHPKEAILASGSKDFTVKLFEYSKPSVKKASTTLTDCEQIRCISFHPGGNHMIVGTNHHVIRMYDVNTSQCYVCPINSHHHLETVTDLKWSPDARVYASASYDGSIKIWDGVSNRCVNTFPKAHEGTLCSSVCFSKNGKYVLSSGRDQVVKLWELSASRCLVAYTGAGATGKQSHRSQAVFNHTEDYVMFPDEVTTSLCVWDSRNANRKQLLSLGHNGSVRFIVHSPCSASFLTCSDDFRARFWYRRTTH